MKIKNLAFFGIMAAIMGVAGTARADTTTVIASQAYVDAKDALKQNLLKSGDGGNIVVTGDTNGNVITGITADGQGTVTVTKGTLDLSGTIGNLDLTDAQATGTGNVVKSVTQNNGQIAVTKGEIVNADVASNAAIADSKIAFSEAHTNALDSGITSTKVSGYDTTKTTVDRATDDNVVATTTTNTNLLKGSGLQNAVAHLKGNGAENYTASVDNTDTANTGIKNAAVSAAAKTAWDLTLEQKKGDNYLTTLAAVERRVQEGVQDAVSQAGTNVSTAYADKNLSNLTDTGKANVSAKGTYNSTTDYDTGTVGKAIKDNAANIATNTTAIATNTTNIGTLANLSTTEKNNLVVAINELDTDINSLDTNKQNASDSKVADGTYNYITQGNGVGANLVALDTRAKANADNIATNTTAIATNTTNIGTNTSNITKLNGDVNTAGSVLNSIKENAEKATFTPGNSGITATNLADAIKEVKTSATSGLDALDVTDTAGNKPVTAVNQTNGQIAVTRGEITYADGLKYNLSNINATGGDGSSACVKGSPCTLTMFMDNDGNPVYEWTNMDTENTDAVL